VTQLLSSLFPPVLSRHILRAFLRTAGLCLVTFLAIAVIVDFFDRFDTFLRYGASAGSILRYFIFKIPTFVSPVAPIAILAGTLLGLGALSRQNEFVALRAAGVSIWQIATAPLAAALLISGLIFLWNERVVPYSSQRAQDIHEVEIKKQPFKRLTGRRRIWYRGLAGFYYIKHASAKQKTLAGLTVYQVSPGFRPYRVIEVDNATWNGNTWALKGVHAYLLRKDGTVVDDPAPDFKLPESPEDFLSIHRQAEEFSYAGLHRYIRDLRRKGAHADEYLVDLHLKLAVPLISLVMVMIGTPLAAKGTRTTSVAGAVAFGLSIGFSYFVVLAFARALGQSGAIDPLLAAWTANGIFGLVGLFLLLGAE